MDHLVQFTISIDDNHIAQMVESRAAKAMESEVLKVCKSQIGGEANYWGGSEPGPMLKKVVDQFMKDSDGGPNISYRELFDSLMVVVNEI